MFRFLTVTTMVLAAVAAAPFLDRASKSISSSATPDSAAALRAAPVPEQVRRPAGFDELTLQADRNGHFRATVEIQGREIETLVDTGASAVSLSYDDARRIGLSPGPSDYKAAISTANGMARAAPVTLAEIRLGTIRVRNVPALVMPPGALSESLLGMSFIRRLGRFDMQGTRLVLAP